MMWHRDLDNSVFVLLSRESVFVLIMYCTLSHMLDHLTSSANGQLYTIKINKDFFETFKMRWWCAPLFFEVAPDKAWAFFNNH